MKELEVAALWMFMTEVQHGNETRKGAELCSKAHV